MNTVIERQEKYTKLKEIGWQGIDRSLEISLLEYGMIWRKDDSQNKYMFINGSYYSDDYQTFTRFIVSEVVPCLEDYELFLTDRFKDYGDIDDEYINDDEHFPYLIEMLISYYGLENILGTIFNELNEKQVLDSLILMGKTFEWRAL